MIINDLDGYYIVFDTKNWNTELDTLSIKAEKPNEQIDSLSVINHLIEINAQKDVEIRELRQAYEHLARCFEKLANGETIAPADKKANSI